MSFQEALRTLHSRPPSERFVITGMGAMSPLGIGVEANWQGALRGITQVSPLDPSYGDFSGHATRIAAQVKNYSESPNFDRKENKKTHRSAKFAMDAAVEAILDAGFQLEPTEVIIEEQTRAQRKRIVGINAEDWGIFIGTCAGGSDRIADVQERVRTKGPDAVDPSSGPLHFLVDRVSGSLSIALTAKGPVGTPVLACGTGGGSLILSCGILRDGLAKMMLAGGSDASITPITFASFQTLRALSRRNEEPEKASVPYSKRADGFVMGEGAGVMVIETLECARARGARIHAEIAGYGWTSDAYHETASSGEGSQRAMNQALSRAGITARYVNYVNAHATSTNLGDKKEAKSIKTVYGEDREDLFVDPTKHLTGHLLGAAGGLEAVLTIKALQTNTVPPYDLEDPIEEVQGLRFAGSKPVQMKINAAASNSFGFDGKNTNIVFIRYEEAS